MKKIIAFVILAFLTSCTNTQYQKTETGIEYKYLSQSSSDIPSDGDVMELHLIYKDENGKELLNTTVDSDGPIPVLCQSEKFIKNGSLEEIFGMLKAGDSIEAKIPAARVFESFGQPVPDSIDANSNLIFNIGVVNVMNRQEYTQSIAEKYMASAKIQLALSLEQIQTDGEIIDQYLAKNKIQAERTESGLRYVITQSGDGNNAKPGDRISVNYVGMVLDGRVFDTCIKEVAQDNNVYNPGREPYQPYPFTLGLGEVIYGWDEALTLLNEGAKATLYIPSSMGYGNQPVDEIIVENSILIFEIELVDIMEL